MTFSSFLAARIKRLERDLARARRTLRQTEAELDRIRVNRDHYRQLAIRGAIQEGRRRGLD